ncbi:hypothetical protein T265_10503 [Opisthorchis viverrini]|uniref:Uncharacterized protein n=1 Tax=Opisthorchis viverrini TaxID=6198 RepID=A0A075A106_OPIVI|nr:hypothetical protein T265_10503 [Opisthorchis viverrini]KER21089.1 hypothetical protein T265_10503 [Opisthorchis viverrini]
MIFGQGDGTLVGCFNQVSRDPSLHQQTIKSDRSWGGGDKDWVQSSSPRFPLQSSKGYLLRLITRQPINDAFIHIHGDRMLAASKRRFDSVARKNSYL